MYSYVWLELASEIIMTSTFRRLASAMVSRSSDGKWFHLAVMCHTHGFQPEFSSATLQANLHSVLVAEIRKINCFLFISYGHEVSWYIYLLFSAPSDYTRRLNPGNTVAV